MPSGRGNQTLFNNRVHWAITYLAHAGLLVRPRRAHFETTARGREVLSRNLSHIDNGVLAEFDEFRNWLARSKKTEEQSGRPSLSSASSTPGVGPEASVTPLERIEADHEEITTALKDDLLQRVLSGTPAFFEKLIVQLLVAMGYGGSFADASRAIGRSGDEGVDGIIKEDSLGLDIVYLQAKKYQPGNTVGRPAVQAFAGSLEGFGATKGVFVTTSEFSREAKEYVGKISKRIILIDGEELANLMVRHNVGVRVEAVYEIKRIDEDMFEQ